MTYVQIFVQHADSGAWLGPDGAWGARRIGFASWPAALRFMHKVGVPSQGVNFITVGEQERRVS